MFPRTNSILWVPGVRVCRQWAAVSTCPVEIRAAVQTDGPSGLATTNLPTPEAALRTLLWAGNADTGRRSLIPMMAATAGASVAVVNAKPTSDVRIAVGRLSTEVVGERIVGVQT